MNLQQWPKRQTAQITEVLGDPVFILRLRDLGLFTGVLVEVLSRLPFSGPLIVRAHGAVFALRQGEAACIQVRAHQASC